MAAMRMSAWRVMSGRSRVRVWHTVTVAFAAGVALHQQGGQGFADDVAAADDDDVLTSRVVTGAEEYLLHAGRSAG